MSVAPWFAGRGVVRYKGLRLKWWWLRAERKPWRAMTVLGRSGWVLTVRQPNGGWTSVSGFSKFHCWRRLLRNRTGLAYYIPRESANSHSEPEA